MEIDMAGLDRRDWEKLLARKERELGFSDGYKFVYGPWRTLFEAEVAFLSLNPGKAPDSADMRVVSDERGNSYEIEQRITKSPITEQFLRLAKILGRRPREILAGVCAPFRSGGWTALPANQKRCSLELGREFWRVPLSRRNMRLVVACSKEAADLAVRIAGASPAEEIPAGWEPTKLRRYRSKDGKEILHLPHLSRFRLLGRTPSEAILRDMLARMGYPRP